MEVTTEMYTILFNAITDTINELEVLKNKLIEYQQITEFRYIMNENK